MQMITIPKSDYDTIVGCNNMLSEEIEELKAKLALLGEITEIKDPEQHFEQIMSANKHLQAEKEKLRKSLKIFMKHEGDITGLTPAIYVGSKIWEEAEQALKGDTNG